MKISRNKILFITSLLILSFVVFAGAALAQGPDGDNGKSMLQQMQEWLSPEDWGAMVQHMNDVHGPEFTDQMLQEMDESGSCHGGDGYEDMDSMMGDSYDNMMGDGYGGMMGGSSGGGQSTGFMM